MVRRASGRVSQAAPLNQAALLIGSFGGLFDVYVDKHSIDRHGATPVDDNREEAGDAWCGSCPAWIPTVIDQL